MKNKKKKDTTGAIESPQNGEIKSTLQNDLGEQEENKKDTN